MSCQFDRAAIVDLARGEANPAAEAHLRSCRGCAAVVERERALTAGLRGLAASRAGAGPSPAVEAVLMSALAAGPGVALSSRSGYTRWLAAAAALVVVAGSAFFARGDFERARSRVVPPDPGVAESAFVPWPGAEVLPAFESGQLVRVELPASVLALLGLVPDRAIDGDSVEADVLIGQDGLARAVRLAP